MFYITNGNSEEIPEYIIDKITLGITVKISEEVFGANSWSNFCEISQRIILKNFQGIF